MGEFDADLALFSEFLSNAQGTSDGFDGFRRSKIDYQKWLAFRDALLRGEDPTPPTMGTRYGRLLVAAAKQHMSISRLVGQVTNPNPPAPPPEGPPPPQPPVFTTNISDGQVITLPFTWTGSVTPTPDSMRFYADGFLLEEDSSSPFSHELTLAPGTHELGLCAMQGTTQICMPPRAGGFGFAQVQIQDPSVSTHRFATFNTATDEIDGTINRMNHPPSGSWWVPGTPYPPSGSTPWPDGGGIEPITTQFGPGLKLRIIEGGMGYIGDNFNTRIARFTWGYLGSPVHLPGLLEGKEHVWEWTWMRPGGHTWPSGQLLEGFNFNYLGPPGTPAATNGSIGIHVFLDNNWNQAGPFHYYAARHTAFGATVGQGTWIRHHCPIPFNPDDYHSIKLEVKYSSGSGGYMRASTSVNGGPFQQWLNFTGQTIPAGAHDPYTYFNVRTVLAGGPIELHWINHRLTEL